MNARADPLIKVGGAKEELGLPETPDALRQVQQRAGEPESGANGGQVFSQAYRASALTQQNRRILHNQAGLGGNQLLGTRLLDREQNRRRVTPGHAAFAKCVSNSPGNGRLTGYDGVMHRVLECDAAVAVPFFAQAPEDLERQLVAITER